MGVYYKKDTNWEVLEPLSYEICLPLTGGLVVANDIDNARCYMLVHQAKRLNSPAVIIINHDATALPNLIYKDDCKLKQSITFFKIYLDIYQNVFRWCFM